MNDMMPLAVVNFSEHFKIGPIRNKAEVRFAQSTEFLRLALYNEKDPRVRHKFIIVDPRPWWWTLEQYRGAGIYLGENIICMQATGRPMHLQQSGANWDVPDYHFQRGYDFTIINPIRHNRIEKVEVKTLYGDRSDSRTETFTPSQLIKATKFVIYNRNRYPRVWMDTEFPAYTCRVFNNATMSHILSIPIGG